MIGINGKLGKWVVYQAVVWAGRMVVLKGAAKLRFEDEEKCLEMTPDDFVNILAHKRHRVEWTTPKEPTVSLAVHYG